MPTEILRPNGAGVATALTASAGSNYQCVDEASADDDTTYVYTTNSVFVTDYYTLDNTALTTETVDSVDIWNRSKVVANAGAGDNAQAGLELSSNEVSGTSNTLTTSYVDREDVGLARPGGGSWAVSDLNSLQGRIRLRQNGTSESRCTQVYVEVNYTASSTAVKDLISFGMIPFAR